MARLDGAHLIQELNVVIRATAEASLGNYDPPERDPVTGLPPVDDPSTSGPSSSWGLGLLDPGPPPVTGATMQTRAPGGVGDGAGGQGGEPRRTRQGGTARQPNKNTLTLAASHAPRRCFVGQLRVTITKPAPDPFHYTGTSITVFGALCAPYNPPLIPGPTTAFVCKSIVDGPLSGLTASNCPAGTLLPDVIARFLSVNVGSDATAVITGDQYDGPGGECSGSSGLGCGGSITPSSPTGTSIGAVITAA